MSKYLFAAALGITLSGVSVLAAVHTIEKFKVSPEQKVMRPALPAAADSAQNKFDEMGFLDGKVPLGLLEQTQNWTTVANDSAHLLQFPAASRSGILRSLKTSIRSPRFAKGNLKLNSNVRAEVFADGVKLGAHSKADSVPSEESFPLELQPEKTVDIQINFLSLPEDPAAPSLGLKFETSSDKDSVLFSGPDTERRFSLATTTIGTFVTSAQISPDGKYILLRYSNTVDGKNYNYNYEVIETSSRKLVYSTSEGVAWMPQGAKLYSAKTAADGNGYEMKVKDIANGSEKIIARTLSNSFYVAPDESFIIYYDEKKGKAESGPMIRIKDPDDRMPGQRDASYLVKQDLKTGQSIPLTYGGPSTWLYDISPDSKRILYGTIRKTPSKFPFYEATMVEMDLSTLKTDTLANGEGEGGFSTAKYSPDGKRLFVTAGPEAFGGIGRNAGNFEYANDFDGQGFLFDIATKQATPVTRDFNPAITGSPEWNKADGCIYFTAEDGFDVPVFCLDPKSGKITRLNNGLDNSRNFSLGNNEGRWMASVGQGYSYAGRATLLDLKSNKVTLLADPKGAEMAGLTLGKEQSWRFMASNGTEIDGMMVLPPDFDATKKYPLIVYYYGGTSPSNKGMSHPYTPHLFASRDYVVYVLNPSGATGYGQEFSTRHVNAWGDWTADEIIEGVKEFCKEHPYVDSKKIGCLGASYGGFMTQYLLTKTDIFSAAVSHAGISNVTSYWGEGYWGYSYNSVAAAKSYPWTNPELFTKHGSLFNADKIHTPLLLLHGNADTNVPVGESIQLFNALQILGREVELIEVDGENHFISDYEKRKLWHATIMAWFARWLQDDPAWWDSMYGD